MEWFSLRSWGSGSTILLVHLTSESDVFLFLMTCIFQAKASPLVASAESCWSTTDLAPHGVDVPDEVSTELQSIP